jgi:hypothetical protein
MLHNFTPVHYLTKLNNKNKLHGHNVHLIRATLRTQPLYSRTSTNIKRYPKAADNFWQTPHEVSRNIRKPINIGNSDLRELF